MGPATVCDVVVDGRSGGGPESWTYSTVGLPLRRGDLVLVPLGSRPLVGVVARVYEATEADFGFPLTRLRGVLNRVEGLSLPEPLMRTVEFVAEEYLCPLSAAIGPALPPGLKDRVVSAWHSTGAPVEGRPLTPMQAEALRVVVEAGDYRPAPSKKLPAALQRALRSLAVRGLVRESLTLAPFGADRGGTELLRLTHDLGRIEAFIAKEGKRKPAQTLVLMRLMASDDATLSSAEIRALTGVTQVTLRPLIHQGLLEPVEPGAQAQETAPTPTLQQAAAIERLSGAVLAQEYRAFLLYGVTGSGKTEVYLRAAAEAIRRGRQVLYLVPEIALAAQAISRLRARFGRRVTVLHSDLAPLERLGNWVRVRQGEAPVVLGARSALFGPMDNLGLVIVDEEHEPGYKQESSPRYHARRTAMHLAREHGCPIVLGSATPSIESFYEAESGDLERLDLPERAASAGLPAVQVVDLAEKFRQHRPALLTEELLTGVHTAMADGRQTILFLNRRAYSPYVLCRECGRGFECPRCAVSLAYSRRSKELRCHHCGFRQRPPDVCPDCGGTKLAPTGVGTEKVEEALHEAFPEARIARLDRDVASKRGQMEETLARFRTGDLDVLVGTQMVAKGLDFPNVTLVGVVLADVSLNIPDFRASERTFQLLSQVAGRAGRGTAKGSVVIQTFNPEHIALQAAVHHDYERAYRVLLEERRAAHYPPFRRLVNVLVSGKDSAEVASTADEVARRLRSVPLGEVLGPAPCAIERVDNRWRRHVLIKLPAGQDVGAVGKALEGLDTKAHVAVDVDPQTLT